MTRPLVLSRFFYDNVKFVADMCPKCYEDCKEVQIVGINVSFLKQFQPNIFNRIFEEPTLGFTKEEMECDDRSLMKFNDYLNKQKEYIESLQTVSKETNGIEDTNKASPHNSFSVSRAVVDKNIVKIRYMTNQKLYLNGLKNISKEKKKKWKKFYTNVVEENEQLSQYFIEYFEVQNDENIMKDTNTYCDNTETKTEPNLTTAEFNNKNISSNNEIKDTNIVSNVKQKEFISNFLFTNLEPKYFEKRKIVDILNHTQSSWSPPRSPHNLIEECLYSDPWALLVATIFLNRTSCLIARPYVFWFLSENPDPYTVLDRFPSDLEKYFVNLGLSKTRAVQVYRMSYDFVFKPWKSVRQLYGIGEYGECAYRMFCLGDLSVEPKDRFLKIYKAWHEKIRTNNFNQNL